MKPCDGTFEKNKKKWFILNRIIAIGRQLHHIWGRIGVLLCCPVLWIMLTEREHNDWRVLKMLRDKTRKEKKMVLDNYMKGIGCKNKRLFKECGWCAMPLVAEVLNNGK